MQPQSFDFNLQFESSEGFTIIRLFSLVLSFWFIIVFTGLKPVLVVCIIGNVVGREGEPLPLPLPLSLPLPLPLIELFIVLILLGWDGDLITLIVLTH